MSVLQGYLQSDWRFLIAVADTFVYGTLFVWRGHITLVDSLVCWIMNVGQLFAIGERTGEGNWLNITVVSHMAVCRCGPFVNILLILWSSYQPLSRDLISRDRSCPRDQDSVSLSEPSPHCWSGCSSWTSKINSPTSLEKKGTKAAHWSFRFPLSYRFVRLVGGEKSKPASVSTLWRLRGVISTDLFLQYAVHKCHAINLFE